MRLKDRVCVVTGGGQGIGAEVARRFAEEGGKVAVVDINKENADQVVKEIVHKGGKAISVACDISDFKSVEEMANTVRNQLGPITVLVNNAGVTRPAMIHKMEEDQFDKVIDVHLKGAWNCVRHTVQDMIDQKYGKIINVTSAAGLMGTLGQVNYASAKMGLVGMIKALATELGIYNITANAVAPVAATPMTDKIRTDPKMLETNLKRSVIKRFPEPEELAGTFVYLASADSDLVTGVVINADAGMSSVTSMR
jgi:3-oxoacyl-[acyl-carrier protein] reductase